VLDPVLLQDDDHVCRWLLTGGSLAHPVPPHRRDYRDRRLRLSLAVVALVFVGIGYPGPVGHTAALTSTSGVASDLVPRINRNVDMLLALRRAAR
jgi:hypothetical protein